MNGSRFSSFLLIISKHWNTLQLNGFIPRKVWDYYSLAAIKLNETILILAKESLSVKEEKYVPCTPSFFTCDFSTTSRCKQTRRCLLWILCFSLSQHLVLKKAQGGKKKKNRCTRRLSPRTPAVALSLLSFALAVYRLGNAQGNKWCSSRLRH